MAGFSNDTVYATNVDFSGSANPAPTILADGQLLIGATAAPNIRVATLTAGAGITITNGAGSITIAATGGVTPVGGLTPDAFTGPGTSPVVGDGSGNIAVTGAQVAAGVVGTNVIRTDSLAANTLTIEIQRATTAAVSTPASNGVAHFDSAIFTVGAGGFVSLVGGAVPPSQSFNVDANTAPGTDPVVPTALGVVNVTGAQVAAGVVGTNVIRTDSLAANTITIEIQRSTATAASTVASNGVSHFDNTIFTVGAGGFVSLVGGAVPPAQKFNVDTSTVPGTDPVVADAGGIVTITGGQVATGTIGTNVIRSNSMAANTITVEIQRSTAVAGSDVTKNGVAHFNSADFTVDANGFVSSTAGAGGGWTFIETQTFAAVPTVVFNTSLASFQELMFTWENLNLGGGFQLFAQFSSDNGSTTLSGYWAALLNSGYAGTATAANYRAFINNIAGGLHFGSLDVQNFSGTRMKLAYGQSLPTAPGSASNPASNIILSSPQINWVQFNQGGANMDGTMTVYGR